MKFLYTAIFSILAENLYNSRPGGTQRMMPILLALLAVGTTSLASAATISYYRFEDGVAGATVVAAVDESGSPALEGAAVGPAIVYSADVSSSLLTSNNLSAFFNGSTNQVIQFGYEFPLHLAGDVTLEFFLKIDHSDHDAIFWTRLNGADHNRFHIYTTNPGQSMSFGFDYREFTAGPGLGILHPLGSPFAFTLEPNTWTHIAIVRTGTTYEWFKDGILKGSSVDSSPNLPNSGGWQLSGGPGGIRALRGLIDEIRISDVALSPNKFLFASPSALLNNLIGFIIDLNLNKGISNSLDAKLDSALSALDDANENNDISAVNKMQAFINAVEAQRGNKISDSDANDLIMAAQDIIELITNP